MRQKTARALKTLILLASGTRADYRRLKRAWRNLPQRARHRFLAPYWRERAEALREIGTDSNE